MIVCETRFALRAGAMRLHQSCVFLPPANETYAYDADGNQTLVTTGTGEWHVEYNGENRPVRWTCVSPDSSTPNSPTPTLVSMAYDHQGRRRLYVEVAAGVTNKLHRFTYDNYLCIARNREVDTAYGSGTDDFVWDPTEPIATRPLMCDLSGGGTLFYCHDGNKNVSEVVTPNGSIAAHYEYSSFGKVVLVTSENVDQSVGYFNPYRFSSEYADDALGLVYYNYRHYNPMVGRWIGRDPIEEDGGLNLYLHCSNLAVLLYDYVGLKFDAVRCFALRMRIQNLSDSLKNELAKYDPVLDGKGGFQFKHGQREGVTKPGGHYEKIQDLQRGLKNNLKQWKDTCSDGPDSCPPIAYPTWADQLANQQIPTPVYNNVPKGLSPTLPVTIDANRGSGFWSTVIASAAAGVAGAIVIGNLGPQALVPEEIVTAPVGAIGGMVVGALRYLIY